jgi:intergrase/recombinase
MDELNMNHKIHDTRKTAVSIMHSAGIPMETVRMIVGHSAKGITESTYLYKTPQELVDAINTINI